MELERPLEWVKHLSQKKKKKRLNTVCSCVCHLISFILKQIRVIYYDLHCYTYKIHFVKQCLLNHGPWTNVYSLKVTKMPAFDFRLPPIRCINDFATILFDSILLSHRLSQYLRAFNNFCPIVGCVEFLVRFCARGAHIMCRLAPIKSLSIPSSIISRDKSCHLGKLKLSCSIGFFSQLPKSSRRNASNSSRLAIW